MDELDVKIILGLAANKLNATKVARTVFMHRNGVVYRIERIKQITGLDPTDFYDLGKLLKMVQEMEEERWLN